MGGSGAGKGGNAAMPGCEAPGALAVVAGSEAPLSAIAADADAGAVADAACPAFAVAVAVALGASLAGAAGVAEAALLAAAAVAVPGFAAEAAVGAAGAMPSGIAVPGGVAEKVLGGNGGRDGAPVDDVLVPAGFGGGVWASCAMLTLVCLFAVA